MLTIKYGIGTVLAGSSFGLIHLTAAAILPSIGSFVDRNGGITMCMVISAFLGLVTNAMWLLIPADRCITHNNCFEYVLSPILLSGVSYALVAGTAWNGTFYLIERTKVGTASGFQSAIMSIVFLILPLMFGWLVDNSQQREKGYFDPLLMQLGLSICSILFNLLNYCYDKIYNDSVLALDVKERNVLFEARKHRSQ